MFFDSVDPQHYARQLQEKAERVRRLFADHEPPPLEVFSSPPLHFRMRAEFRIWHRGDTAHYAMTPRGSKQPQPIEDFSIGSRAMVELMPVLLAHINANSVLRRKLYAAEFLTSLSGEVLVTLIYHRPLDDDWQQAGQALARELDIDLIGRSRKRKLVVGKDYVTEELSVNGRTYRYQQVETGFTQPNARVNERMLGWSQEITNDSEGDLLELYCGNGNFTLPLAANFRRVLATEVSKISVRSARQNLADNDIDNVTIVRMSSEEFTDALNGVRPFNRLKHIDLADYDFSTLFVDPPRAGLDDDTLALASRFDRILYISCNPATLKANIDTLSPTHAIRRLALFDQFPYTDHIECGALLERSDSTV